jgi:hypothetical protein
MDHGVGGGEWESNPPIATKLRYTGFEDQESHQALCTSRLTIAYPKATPGPTCGLYLEVVFVLNPAYPRNVDFREEDYG